MVSVNTGKLCPTGWHIPTNTEWTTMMDYLIANGFNYDGTTTDNKIAKAMAATTLWAASADIGAPGNTDFPVKRNATDFTALPGGIRDEGGGFVLISFSSFWWTSTDYTTGWAWAPHMNHNWSNATKDGRIKTYGCNIRCTKD